MSSLFGEKVNKSPELARISHLGTYQNCHFGLIFGGFLDRVSSWLDSHSEDCYSGAKNGETGGLAGKVQALNFELF